MTDQTPIASPRSQARIAGFLYLIIIVVGAVAHSRTLALGMGIYGVGRSVYGDFLGRGSDVEFPKGTALEVGLWLRRDCAESALDYSGSPAVIRFTGEDRAATARDSERH